MGQIRGTDVIATFTNSVYLTTDSIIFMSGSQSVWTTQGVSGSSVIQCLVPPVDTQASSNPSNNGTTTGGIATSTSSIWWDTGFKVTDCPSIKLSFLPLSGSIFNDVDSSLKNTSIALGVAACLTASSQELSLSAFKAQFCTFQLAQDNVTNDPGHGYGNKYHKFYTRNQVNQGQMAVGTEKNGPLKRAEFSSVITPNSGSDGTALPDFGPYCVKSVFAGNGNLIKAASGYSVAVSSAEDRVYIFVAVKRCSLESAGAGAADNFKLRFKLVASFDKIPKDTIPGQDGRS